MTKVLIFVSACILILSGSFSKADSPLSEVVQTQSNIDIQDDLNVDLDQIRKLPITMRTPFDFSIFNQVAPPSGVAPQAQNEIMESINIFPVLDYRTKEFMFDMGPGDIYRKTADHDDAGRPINLDRATLTSRGAPFHLTTLDGKIIGDGTTLSFHLTKKSSTFTLDKKTGPFSGLIVTQDPEVVTKVTWISTTSDPEEIKAKLAGVGNKVSKVKGANKDPDFLNYPVSLNYIGNFVITPQITPRNVPCIQINNVLELERYISLVVPGELTPEGKPLAVLETHATISRDYALGKGELREMSGSNFNLYASTQDQLLKGIIFEKDREKNEVRQPENAAVLQAVANTKNKVIFSGGRLARQAMFSANCAGRSVSYQDYSGGKSKISYLVSVPEYNKDSLRRLATGTATFNLTTQNLADLLKKAGVKFPDGQVLEVDPINLNSSDRATVLRFRGPKSTVTVPASGPQFEALRKGLAKFAVSKLDNELRPYMDSAVAVGNNIVIKSYGVGHNVGFCQEGGVLMAESILSKGKEGPETYKQIITHYYKGTTVSDYHQDL